MSCLNKTSTLYYIIQSHILLVQEQKKGRQRYTASFAATKPWPRNNEALQGPTWSFFWQLDRDNKANRQML